MQTAGLYRFFGLGRCVNLLEHGVLDVDAERGLNRGARPVQWLLAQPGGQADLCRATLLHGRHPAIAAHVGAFFAVTI